MEYKRFKEIFNECIFEESKAILIEKISKYPNRYIGLFRPTKPKAKILQNLLQSHEIRFGEAFEEVIEEYLKNSGFNLLPKKYSNEDNRALNIDQCFKDAKNVFFIEQKVRDDHDSTKKRGQIDNFVKKLEVMIKEHGEKKIIGIFYFIDPEIIKNKKYYQEELNKMQKDYGVKLYLFYGKELFEFLKITKVWDEILKYLEEWKKDIPDLPETNFDIDAQSSFEEIRDLSPAVYRDLFKDDVIFNDIVLTIFPQKKTLKLLLEYFKSKSKEMVIYSTLAKELERKLG